MTEIDIGGPITMAEAEAMIMSEIEKIGSLPVDKKEEIVNEMRLMVSLMKEKRLEDGSCRLSCLISEIVEIVKTQNCSDKMPSLWSMLTETNKRLRESGKGSHEDDGDIVGFEEDVEELLHKLNIVEQQQHHFVACIQGIVGSGKTALARQLYNHADVVDKFNRRVWVSCREILSEKELLVNLLRQVADVDHHGAAQMDRKEIRNRVIQQLRDQRCFIVLDDLCGLYSFQSVIDSLQGADKGRSMLLLTCRTMIKSFFVYNLHNMKPLDVDKSWQLLLNTMFPSNDHNQFPKHVVRSGKIMLMKHSGGLPFVVKEVAMEWLAMRGLGTPWEEVVGSKDLKLRASLEAIDSSVYQNLNPDYKSLFLHLGFFKQGTTIIAQRLLETWMASGALGVSRPELDYEVIVHGFIQHYILEVKNKDKYDDIKNYHVGAIFHKLSVKKINEGDEGASYGIVYCSRKGFNCSIDRNERLTCVSFNGGGCLDTSPPYWKRFEMLRVLEFEGFGLKFLPEAIGELIELRYLGLRNNYIQELPSSLSCLKKLEVLDIALNFMVKVSDIIWKMDALVHLYMSDIFFMKPLRKEALKNLRTLIYISVDNWLAFEASSLQMMTSLWKLGIMEMHEGLDASTLFESLAALVSLTSLKLRGSRFRSMPSLDKLGVLRSLRILKLDGFITKLPSHENFPPYLSYLVLVNSCIDEDPMPTLEKLPELHYLKLQNAYTGQEMMISKGGCPKLRHLCIGELWHLRSLRVAQGALTWLNKLEVTSCPYLQSLPEDIITKNNLELNIVATKNIATKAKESGNIVVEEAEHKLMKIRRLFQWMDCLHITACIPCT